MLRKMLTTLFFLIIGGIVIAQEASSGNASKATLNNEIAPRPAGWKSVYWRMSPQDKVTPPPPPCTSSGTAAPDCSTAPLVCNFDGLCGSTPDASHVYTWPELDAAFSNCKTGSASIQNNSFVQFVASATSVSFYVWVTASKNGDGVQMLFFDGACGSGNVNVYGCYFQIKPTTTAPKLVSASGLTIGKTYYLMFDGVGGDACDYVVQPQKGVNVVDIKVDPSLGTVCLGTQVNLAASGGADSTNANSYTWTSSASPSGLTATSGKNVAINTTTTGAGSFTYTLTGKAIGTCDATKTTTINVVDLPVIATQPSTANQNITIPALATPLSVSCSLAGVTYQWYSNSTSSSAGGAAISGATSNTYTPPTAVAGTTYYYCVVTNNGCSKISDVSGAIIVKPKNTCNTYDGLSFVQQPTTSAQGSAMSPAVQVQVFCQQYGNVTDYTGKIALTAKNACGFVSDTINAVNGVATFSNVVFTRSVQNGVSLIATMVGKGISVESDTFSIIAPTSGGTNTVQIVNEDFSGYPSTKKWAYTEGPIVEISTKTPPGTKGKDVSGVVTKVGNSYLRKSYSVNNGSGEYGTMNTFTFANITGLSTYNSLNFSFKIASLNESGTLSGAQGVDKDEDLIAQVSFDNGSSWQTVLRYGGYINKLFSFSTLPAIKLVVGSNDTTRGGDVVNDTSAFSFDLPANTSQFQFRVTASDNRKDENWCLDDLVLTGITVVKSSPLPTITLGNDTSICSNTAATLPTTISNALAPVVYTWTPASQLVDATLQLPTTVKLTATQAYTLSLTDKDGCTAVAKDSIKVIVNPTPAITSQNTPTQTLCAGGSFTPLSVAATHAESYQWYSNISPSNSGGTLVTGANTATFVPPSNVAGTTYYYCTVSGSCNPAVVSAVSGAIVVKPLPTIGTTDITPACGVTSVDLTTTTAISNTSAYQLSFFTDYGLTTPVATPKQVTAAQKYYIKIVNTATGCSSEDSITVNAFISGASISARVTGNGCASKDSLIARFPNSITSLVWTNSTTGATVTVSGGTRAAVGVTVAGGNGQGNALNQLDLFSLAFGKGKGGGVAVDDNKNVYVGDYNNNRVMKWPKGATAGTLVAGGNVLSGPALNQLYHPFGVSISSTGSLYVVDLDNSRVLKFLPGSLTGIIVAGPSSSHGSTLDKLNNPANLFVDKDSNVYVADAGDNRPAFLGGDPTHNNRIMLWPNKATQGTQVAGAADGSGTDAGHLYLPTGVYVDKSGSVYVADFNNNRIQKWTSPAGPGTTVANLGSDLNPTDVVVDENTGLLYITATNYFPPLVYTNTKHQLLSWVPNATSGTVINASAANGDSLASPSGLTLTPDGSIYVVDAKHNRVQAWLTAPFDTVFVPAVAGDYYAEVTYGNGCKVQSSKIVVNSSVAPSVAIVADKSTICEGTNVTFTSTVTNEGNAPTYQWLKDKSVIANEKGNKYSTTTLKKGDSIVCVLTSSVGCAVPNPDSSNIVVVQVDSTTVPGTIAANQTLCAGSTPADLKISGNVGSILKWQRSTDSTFKTLTTDIANTSTLLKGTAIGPLTDSTYFRAIVQSGSCGKDTTLKVRVNVLPNIKAFTITGSTTICSGTKSTVLTLSDSAGKIQWKSSIDNISFTKLTNDTAKKYTATNLSQTMYYRAVVSNGICADSASATITVIPAATADTIKGGTTVCAGTNSTLLTLTKSNGNIQWQSSADSIAFADISGEIATTYTASNLNTTAYYRAVVSNGTCSDTAYATVKVVPAIKTFTVNGATTICSGTKSTVLTLSDSTGRIQWKSSFDNISFTNLTNDTAKKYTATNLTQTMYYRAVVSNGTCADSASATITVVPAATADTIKGGTTVCAGTNSTLLTLTESNGSIQWQSSADSIAFADISGEIATTYTASNLNTTAYYRAVVSNGTCSDTAYATVKVVPAIKTFTVNGATTICSGTKSTVLTLSDSTGRIQWKSSIDNISFTKLTNDTAKKYTATNLSQTMYYRAVVSNGTCADSASTTITVVPAATADTIKGGTTVCAGTNSTLLTLTKSNGSIQWQSSADSIAFADISGEIATTYTASNLNTTVYYRAVVSNGICSDTAYATVKVVPAAKAGTINGGATVCSGTNSTLLTLSGSIGNIQWKSSTDNIIFTDIQGETSNKYTATNLTDTMYYRVIVSNGNCADSVQATIYVDPIPVAGTINKPDTLCVGTNTITLDLKNSVGSIQWQSSIDNITFTNITNATSASLTENNLSATTYYRAVVSSGVCASASSPSVKVVVNSKATPSVSIAITTGSNSICESTSVTFTASTTNGGKAPVYQWLINGTIMSGAINDTYTSTTLKDKDTVTCTLTSSLACTTTATAISNKIGMAVNTKATPTIIVTPTSTSICEGTSVTFTATTTNEGTNPTYQWAVKGVNVGTNANTYTSTTLKDKDTVTCTLKVQNTCVTASSVTSTAVKMAVATKQTPSVSITPGDTTICDGVSITLTANPVNGGTSPTYQWKVNGVVDRTVTGATYPVTFTSTINKVTCVLTNNDMPSCLTTNTAASTNTPIITVSQNVTPAVVVSVVSPASTTICAGTTVTFNATPTNGGAVPSYQWKLNGKGVGINNASFTSSTLQDQDVVTCVMTSNAQCLVAGNAIANSNSVTITVTPAPVVASITGTDIDTLCADGNNFRTGTFMDVTPGGKWSSSNRAIITIDPTTGVATAASEGNATILYSVTGCGTTSVPKSVNVSRVPAVLPIEANPPLSSFTAPVLLCIDGTALLTDQKAGGVWSSLQPTIATVSTRGVVTGLDTGFAQIEYRITNKCGTAPTQQLVDVLGKKPTVSIVTKDPTCINTDSGRIQISATGPSVEQPYNFTLNNSGVHNPSGTIVSNLRPGKYAITNYNGIGCVVDQFPVTLAFPDEGSCDTLYVPTGFVPASNSKSGVLKPYGGGALRSLSFRIFNRFGNLLFESHDIFKGWDGKVNDVLQQPGTYIWMLEYTQANGMHRAAQGTSVLIR
ncbi:hypothetical protein [Parasediminibacterium sp. JCM 36343]|uniref:Ig-like domain-containing protein n=1 Tax=Parasediminibacterium sp. JCM 36343 TaxID=3374279 RepID=UPI00397E6349